ncbi:DUF6714 family protein [Amantichitinum ursilacus]|uniref:Uncharacterized protein n=1 Tax=Amantichitinum ursilacus TaxID=857265 RepID=A0A0N0GM92_9NEIS|nr:DUF6714 family protein [Amantichitinum ursilacus]KPC50705.1 hypothetical protein WG78_16665 [Amantichitinum ursilacus]
MNLIQQLRIAFSARLRPEALQDSIELEEWEQKNLAHIGRFPWTELTAEDWEKYSDVISWLSPAAFCYYLPSLIKVSVEENLPNLIAVASIVMMLDRSPRTDWWDDFFRKRWTLLSMRECEVVQGWLFWIASCPESAYPDDSLERSLATVDLLISLIN